MFNVKWVVGALVVWGLVLAWAFKVVYGMGYDAAELKWQQKQTALMQQQADKARQASMAFQVEKAKLEREWRERNEKLEQIIAKNAVYHSRCMDTDGLRELNERISKTR